MPATTTIRINDVLIWLLSFSKRFSGLISFLPFERRARTGFEFHRAPCCAGQPPGGLSLRLAGSIRPRKPGKTTDYEGNPGFGEPTTAAFNSTGGFG